MPEQDVIDVAAERLLRAAVLEGLSFGSIDEVRARRIAVVDIGPEPDARWFPPQVAIEIPEHRERLARRGLGVDPALERRHLAAQLDAARLGGIERIARATRL